MLEVKQLFPGFSDELLKEIDAHASIHHFRAGDVLMRTGQYIKSTILVLSGRIKVYREDEEGGEFFMYYLQPGQACAISMICATRAEKSQIMAKVMEDTEVVMIPLAMMEKWMASQKSWYEFVVDTYRNRFEEVLMVIDSIAFRAMDERLELYLKRQKEAIGQSTIFISHQEIADDLNSSREVISRLLKKMEQRKLVNLHRNHIELLF